MNEPRYIILVRNPDTKRLLAVTEGDDGDELAQFTTKAAAIAAAQDQVLCKAWGAIVIDSSEGDYV